MIELVALWCVIYTLLHFSESHVDFYFAFKIAVKVLLTTGAVLLLRFFHL
jgi:hypothetical protein